MPELKNVTRQPSCLATRSPSKPDPDRFDSTIPTCLVCADTSTRRRGRAVGFEGRQVGVTLPKLPLQNLAGDAHRVVLVRLRDLEERQRGMVGQAECVVRGHEQLLGLGTLE